MDGHRWAPHFSASHSVLVEASRLGRELEMCGFFLPMLLAFLVPSANAEIVVDLNCTTYATEFVYSPTAVVCNNVISDAACKILYPATDDADPKWPEAGTADPRPFSCYTDLDDGTGVLVPDLKRAALSTCPKQCGYCCQTDAYRCSNVQFPRLNCNTITATQCRSATWRTIIAQDCPSACGFCNEGGCVDGVLDCANDISICNAVGMQDFVNTYCQRTCGRCASSTTRASTGTGTCTTYIADSSTACAGWAANGFCTNTFYTAAQRRAYCATTCRLC